EDTCFLFGRFVVRLKEIADLGRPFREILISQLRRPSAPEKRASTQAIGVAYDRHLASHRYSPNALPRARIVRIGNYGKIVDVVRVLLQPSRIEADSREILDVLGDEQTAGV